MTRKHIITLVGLVLFCSILAVYVWMAQTIDNGLADEVNDHIRAIYRNGQEQGNRGLVFSKVGDSLTVSRNFLYTFGIGEFNTGEYDYLDSMISQYSIYDARNGNSFINESLAAGEGWAASAVLNPEFANPGYCEWGETPLECEYRLVRPSIALIMFGTNDVGYRSEAEFAEDLQSIVGITEEAGIIPVLSTIPDRPDVPFQVQLFNDIIRETAREHNLPVIELYYGTVNLPNHGLTWDNVHLSAPPEGRSGTGIITPINLQYGYVVRNWLTLEMLYAIHAVVGA